LKAAIEAPKKQLASLETGIAHLENMEMALASIIALGERIEQLSGEGAVDAAQENGATMDLVKAEPNDEEAEQAPKAIKAVEVEAPWSENEMVTLNALHSALGDDFSKIAASLPGKKRTAEAVAKQLTKDKPKAKKKRKKPRNEATEDPSQGLETPHKKQKKSPKSEAEAAPVAPSRVAAPAPAVSEAKSEKKKKKKKTSKSEANAAPVAASPVAAPVVSEPKSEKKKKRKNTKFEAKAAPVAPPPVAAPAVSEAVSEKKKKKKKKKKTESGDPQ